MEGLEQLEINKFVIIQDILEKTGLAESSERSCCTGRNFAKVALAVASIAAAALGFALAAGLLTFTAIPWVAPAMIGVGAVGFTAVAVWSIVDAVKAAKKKAMTEGALKALEGASNEKLQSLIQINNDVEGLDEETAV